MTNHCYRCGATDKIVAEHPLFAAMRWVCQSAAQCCRNMDALDVAAGVMTTDQAASNQYDDDESDDDR